MKRNTGKPKASVSLLTLTGTRAFTLGAAAPVPPFSVGGGASVDIPVHFQPTTVLTTKRASAILFRLYPPTTAGTIQWMADFADALDR